MSFTVRKTFVKKPYKKEVETPSKDIPSEGDEGGVNGERINEGDVGTKNNYTVISVNGIKKSVPGTVTTSFRVRPCRNNKMDMF